MDKTAVGVVMDFTERTTTYTRTVMATPAIIHSGSVACENLKLQSYSQVQPVSSRLHILKWRRLSCIMLLFPCSSDGCSPSTPVDTHSASSSEVLGTPLCVLAVGRRGRPVRQGRQPP